LANNGRKRSGFPHARNVLHSYNGPRCRTSSDATLPDDARGRRAGRRRPSPVADPGAAFRVGMTAPIDGSSPC
jgi:hypothetical protein